MNTTTHTRMRAPRRWIAYVGIVALSVAMLVSCKKKSEPWPASMRVVAPADVASEIRVARGHAVLVVLYASWCHSCREELPDLDAVAATRKADGLTTLAYSLDEDPNDFSEMLRTETVRFDLVRVAPLGGPDLARTVQDFGGAFRGAIPYVAVLDRDGALVADATGGMTRAKLDAVVTQALARGAAH